MSKKIYILYLHYDEIYYGYEYNKEKPDDIFKPWGFQPGRTIIYCTNFIF